MKHLAFPHPFGTPRRSATGHRVNGDPRSTLAAIATATSAAIARRFPLSPRPQALDTKVAAGAAALPAETAAARWERQGSRIRSLIEGLVLALLIAFFGGGLAAILGGF